MATYKVIQDIEAEDKFLGPLTLKQFVFGAGGAFFVYLSILMIKFFPFGLVLTVPPMLIGFFLAVPWSKDQPTEVWVLAKLRFYVKPRLRIWDQTGMEELVTITVPKKAEKQLSDNLSQTEVKSRLEALAQTIDSRGWAIKELPAGAVYQPFEPGSDRLVSTSILPKEVPIMDTSTIPDVYAGETATSANFDRMIEQSAEMRKAQNLEKMDRIRHGEPLENIIAPKVHFTPPSPGGYAPYATSKIDEKSLTEELKHRREPDSIAKAHMRKISPLSAHHHKQSGKKSHKQDSPDNSDKQKQAEKQTPDPRSTAILEYAGNNDLNISTIARQVKKDIEDDANEVVISLR